MEQQVEMICRKLDEMYPSKNMLNIKEIVAYTGLSRNTVKRITGLSKGEYIDKASLAMKLAR